MLPLLRCSRANSEPSGAKFNSTGPICEAEVFGTRSDTTLIDLINRTALYAQRAATGFTPAERPVRPMTPQSYRRRRYGGQMFSERCFRRPAQTKRCGRDDAG